ncbi:MAG TPA: protoheme IX farnesyltransferase [Candidatus Latescibacteria bacterium]|mgnify:CR=1 FL=1|nr:protoheme IX farnesyltransferase [Candidatus Latescibacterota bacterium]|tara:strand:+ start:1541 stop:2401 length:861 start_codon:yes stop_codon:yes gene_type:complete
MTLRALDPYFELTKPRIVTMVLVTTALGFFVGGHGVTSPLRLALTLLGTAFSAGGSGVLNHYIERDIDAVMRRTRDRPLPSGRVTPAAALSLGFLLILAGQVVLVLTVNLMTAWLALLTAFLYVVIYTPLKRTTWLNTSLGSIPGALPPVGGWAAATGHLDAGAWVLFAILFAWQHPHFYSIAWIFRDDYRRGGFKMLPVLEEDGKRTCRHILAFSVLLIAVSILPALLGSSGTVYLLGALVLGAGMLAAGVSLTISRSNVDARRLLRASVIYLPLLLILTVFDSI